MAGFGMSLGAFAEGLASGRASRKDREEREKAGERQDRWLDIMEKQSAGGGAMPLLGAMPPGSAPMGGGSGFGRAGAGSGKSGGLFGLIDRTEGAGNYDTLFGHSQNGGKFAGTQVSGMTLDQLSDFASPKGAYGQWVASQNNGVVATPMGRHQIVGTTLRNAAQQMGLPGDTKFTGDVQDSIANHLASRRLAGASTPAAARAAMRAEWDGFRKVPDAELDAAIADFRKSSSLGAARPAF